MNNKEEQVVSGECIDFSGERYYAIRNVDNLAPFFISVISNSDHWLFVSSSGGLSAGRVSPDTALFPYVTVDKIHESAPHTGCKTIIRASDADGERLWEPFNLEHDGLYSVSRNLYKNFLGNKLCFEEVNHDLQLQFRYTWSTSDQYGFVRLSELKNLSDKEVSISVIDGLQNILPAGAQRFAQTNSSNLVDAYKWTELEESTGLALYTLYSGITDRAEPCESLRANTAFCLGLESKQVLLSSRQLEQFRAGNNPRQEPHKRGIRGAYFVVFAVSLAPHSDQSWQLVANIEQSQKQVVDLLRDLAKPDSLREVIAESVSEGSDELARIMAGSDGFQTTYEEYVSLHHYANVVFNVLRGGTFVDQYSVPSADFAQTVKHFNREVYIRHIPFLEGLSERISIVELQRAVKAQNDRQLERLCNEYLPITFGRRHGDPSRPWNQFAIRLKDENGGRLLSYQGNWRDIFQNWEALTFSFPEFIESVITKFVNASTADGYNPYRITKNGIDWEIEEPEDPWSFIGYWGDHQIIYLLKLLEHSKNFHPEKLDELLFKEVFCYANVPYRIKPFSALLKNAKDTVLYDEALEEEIGQRITTIGADGKLLLDADGSVYQVNLIEKLLVPLLTKLSNLVADGGIWLNTQRPEWNDANNALVGQGLSMVTLYYMRRYVGFLRPLFASTDKAVVELSTEVIDWLSETAEALHELSSLLATGSLSNEQRFAGMARLGEAGSQYRRKIYQQPSFTGKSELVLTEVAALLDDAQLVIDRSISTNRRDDGLYHAYNLLQLESGSTTVNYLYPMLEGQVAVLSSGAIAPREAVNLLTALFESAIYRPDQETFMLYPDRELPGFLAKNRIPANAMDSLPLLARMAEKGDERLVSRDAEGTYRFNADFTNAGDLWQALEGVTEDYGDDIRAIADQVVALYEQVFNHQAFTGRSGGMFGFEGLGCIYWHMVAKLLLAVQEIFFAALDRQADRDICRQLGKLYYRVRQGIGFNKTPEEYGAFPTDPYSHTPKHAGAQQPGMTGQVKEEVLSRFGELGIRVSNGVVAFKPGLLRAREFLGNKSALRYLDVDNAWQRITVPSGCLAFTWCQVPILYELNDSVGPSLTILDEQGSEKSSSEPVLSRNDSQEIFQRTGRIRQIRLVANTSQLFAD